MFITNIHDSNDVSIPRLRRHMRIGRISRMSRFTICCQDWNIYNAGQQGSEHGYVQYRPVESSREDLAKKLMVCFDETTRQTGKFVGHDLYDARLRNFQRFSWETAVGSRCDL